MLFVTVSEARIETLRGALSDLPAEFAASYRFGLFSEVVADPLGAVWKSRVATDGELYRLVRN